MCLKSHSGISAMAGTWWTQHYLLALVVPLLPLTGTRWTYTFPPALPGHPSTPRQSCAHVASEKHRRDSLSASCHQDDCHQEERVQRNTSFHFLLRLTDAFSHLPPSPQGQALPPHIWRTRTPDSNTHVPTPLIYSMSSRWACQEDTSTTTQVSSASTVTPDIE